MISPRIGGRSRGPLQTLPPYPSPSDFAFQVASRPVTRARGFPQAASFNPSSCDRLRHGARRCTCYRSVCTHPPGSHDGQVRAGPGIRAGSCSRCEPRTAPRTSNPPARPIRACTDRTALSGVPIGCTSCPCHGQGQMPSPAPSLGSGSGYGSGSARAHRPGRGFTGAGTIGKRRPPACQESA